MSDPRYPIGKFSFAGPLTGELKEKCLDDIEQTPARLRAVVQGLSEKQLDTPYRDGGWTVRQVVHHVPDSHMNSYVRFKLALTEEEPTIRPYMENLWAELPEARTAPIELSLALLEGLHKRWMLDAARVSTGRLEAKFSTSGTRVDDSGEEPGPLRLARPPPRGARHGAERADGMVGKESFKVPMFQSFRVLQWKCSEYS